MKLVHCANGHYYDEEVYSRCPYCDGTVGSSDKRGKAVGYEDALDDGKTVGYEDYLDDGKTVGYNGLGTTEDREKAGGKFDPLVGWLVCIEGAEKGRDYKIFSGRNYIGRAVNNDICVSDDDSISRQRHFSIVYDPRSRRFFALPGESSTIQINEEVKYNKHLLSDGDIITCGKSKLCFIGFCKEGRDWT